MRGLKGIRDNNVELRTLVLSFQGLTDSFVNSNRLLKCEIVLFSTSIIHPPFLRLSLDISPGI